MIIAFLNISCSPVAEPSEDDTVTMTAEVDDELSVSVTVAVFPSVTVYEVGSNITSGKATYSKVKEKAVHFRTMLSIFLTIFSLLELRSQSYETTVKYGIQKRKIVS